MKKLLILFLLLVGVVSGAEINPQGAVLWLPFNSWSKGNGLTDQNTGEMPAYPAGTYDATFTSFVADSGYIYNSGDGYCIFNKSARILTTFNPNYTAANTLTFECRFKYTYTGLDQYFFAQYVTGSNMFRIYIDASNGSLKAMFTRTGADYWCTSIASTILDGSTYIFHFRKDALDMDLFVDGVEVTYAIHNNYPAASVTYIPMRVGNFTSAVGFQSPLYFAAIYDVAFTQARITANAAFGNDMGFAGHNYDDDMHIIPGYPYQLMGGFDGSTNTIYIGEMILPCPANAIGLWNMNNDSVDVTGNQDFFRIGGTAYGTSQPGYAQCCTLDGIDDYDSIPDNNRYTFNSAGQDLPFSMCAWIYMKDATNFSIITKYAGSNREYLFWISGADELTITLYIESTGKYIGRQYNSALTGNENSWIHAGVTYSGNETSAGCKLYLNGARVDDGDLESLPYTGMENKASAVGIGGRSEGVTLADGYIDQPYIVGAELTPQEVYRIYNDGREAHLTNTSTDTITLGD